MRAPFPSPKLSGRQARLGSAAILLIGFCSFLPYLDKYPAPYEDDAWFNGPAIRVHEGLSFASPVGGGAPYEKTIWAYHGQFFPRLQVVTIRLLGVSQFACRIPQYAAAFLAVWMLCWMLSREGLAWAAPVLAIAWMGDRSLMEVLYGRMEGLALLFLALAFTAFVRALCSRTSLPVFLSSLFAATAAGFHPSATFFPLVILLNYLVRFRGLRWRTLFLWTCGATIPFLITLAFIAPHFREAAIQFRWHQLEAGGGRDKILTLARALKWSRYWVFALVLCSGTVLAAAAWNLRAADEKGGPDPVTAVFFGATLFSLAGCAALFSAALQPYYLVYLSLWPVAAIMAGLSRPQLTAGARRLLLASAMLLLASWLPSAAWNFMRWREAVIETPKIDQKAFSAQIQAIVPRGADVKVSPEFFLLGRPFGPDAAREWFARANELPSGAYLALSERDVRALGGLQAEGLRSRPILYQGPVYPAVPKYAGDFVILGPSEGVSEKHLGLSPLHGLGTPSGSSHGLSPPSSHGRRRTGAAI
jgi:hypothetical protein